MSHRHGRERSRQIRRAFRRGLCLLANEVREAERVLQVLPLQVLVYSEPTVGGMVGSLEVLGASV